MPSFMFACGFSYRLTALKRLDQTGRTATYRRFVWRSLGLVLVSLMMYGFGGGFRSLLGDDAGERPPVRRQVAQGEPLGGAGDHRGGAVADPAGDRRRAARARPPRCWPWPGASAALVLLQFRLRLRPTQPPGRLPRDGRARPPGTAASSACSRGRRSMLAGTLAYDAAVAMAAGKLSARLLGWGGPPDGRSATHSLASRCCTTARRHRPDGRPGRRRLRSGPPPRSCPAAPPGRSWPSRRSSSPRPPSDGRTTTG